jgi:hypothetical protein
MKRTVGTAAAVVGLVGAFAFVGPGQADSSFRNQYADGTQTEVCQDPVTGQPTGDTIEYAGPEMMWPPNHKMQPVAFTAYNGSAAPVSTALSVLADAADAVGGDGGAQHDPDESYPAGPSATGTDSATVPFEIRSERSGKGEGRTYTLTAEAVFDQVRTCTMTVDVVVPHDMRDK